MTEVGHRWVHPLCNHCWHAHQPGRKPYRLTGPQNSRCCGCGRPTTSGIYVRIEPGSAAIPFCADTRETKRGPALPADGQRPRHRVGGNPPPRTGR